MIREPSPPDTVLLPQIGPVPASTVVVPGPDGLGPYHEAAMDLCAGADVLIHDAQHTAEELPGRNGYGHSAAGYPVELARRCGIERVLLFHHDPTRTDAAVADIERSFGSVDSVTVEAPVRASLSTSADSA